MQPYVQTSLAPRANQKLSYKFYGPFRVLSRIGSVAYKLELPESSSLHPVFHVSQLKKVVSSNIVVNPFPLAPSDSLEYPERILQTRMITKNARVVTQALIKWSSMPMSLATWKLFINVSRMHLLGVKQDLKREGVSVHLLHRRRLQLMPLLPLQRRQLMLPLPLWRH